MNIGGRSVTNEHIVRLCKRKGGKGAGFAAPIRTSGEMGEAPHYLSPVRRIFYANIYQW